MKHFFTLLLLSSSLLSAQDILFLRSGEKRSGRLSGLDDLQFRLQVPLPPPPGATPETPPVFAFVSIARKDVEHIEFAPDPARDAILGAVTPPPLADLEAAWTKAESWLSVPRSPTARIGNLLGNQLLQGGDPAQAARALELFKKIEDAAWDPADKLAARQGRLRAMVATGRAKEAVQEAVELAGITENPVVLIEAKYVLATAAEDSLRKLLRENPRWEEDIYVIPKRHRLYNEALDLYLYPSLFVGSETEPAARGLWGAAGIYQLAGESQKALECARDIITIYPGTKFAKPAAEFIASLPEAQRAIDPEKEAREEMAGSESPEVKPQKQSHEKNTTKKS